MTQCTTPVDARQLVDRMFAAEFAFMAGGGSDPAVLADGFHPDVVIHEPTSLPYAGDWLMLVTGGGWTVPQR